MRIHLCLVGLIAVILAGCTSAAPSQTVAKRAIPVLYSPIAQSEPLSPERIDQIQRCASLGQPQERKIWFILVTLNDTAHVQDHYGYHFRAEVYFTPDAQSAQISKGEYVEISNPTVYGAGATPSPNDLHRSQVKKYVHVLNPQKPFVAENAADLSLMPFPAPKDLADTEIVSLVSYLLSFENRPLIHSEITTQPDGSMLATYQIPNKIGTNMRIHSIRSNNGIYTVLFCSFGSPIYPSGVAVKLTRAANGYTIQSVSHWAS